MDGSIAEMRAAQKQRTNAPQEDAQVLEKPAPANSIHEKQAEGGETVAPNQQQTKMTP